MLKGLRETCFLPVEKKTLLAQGKTLDKIDFSIFVEDPLEKEMAAHSNILAWRIP